ncbi:putative alpha-1,6-mannosyltransferase mnn11 [Kalmusia sp. IMI 367209]|nr:putative alpha-1,6-mannosyltransferase mnn11 [Kalmusia sp. IMI 367209]
MHFAMPPRKTSRPPPYQARNQSSLPIPPALKNLLRRDKLRTIVLGVLGFLTLIWLFRRAGGGEVGANIPKVDIGSGPPVVIVTTIDPKANAAWVGKIKKNREDYAKRHGYLTFFPQNNEYPLNTSPHTWSKVPALRHAMTMFPGSTFFWYLDSAALIMNSEIDLQSHVLKPSRLEELMITNEPVVPPDSVIKTFGNLKGDRIDFIVTQDKEGLTPTSIIVRNGEWAKYFLDAWFDPIYRSYNFQKAESHALEHIVQWHGTILAKLALIPQNILNSYATGPANPKFGKYREGDFVANFPGCARDKADCAAEQKSFLDKLNEADD